jgi:hypothetical protein
MGIYESDIIALILFVIGLYILIKGDISFSLEAGNVGNNKFVTKAPSNQTEVRLNGLKARILGGVLIIVGIVIFVLLNRGKIIMTL